MSGEAEKTDYATEQYGSDFSEKAEEKSDSGDTVADGGVLTSTEPAEDGSADSEPQSTDEGEQSGAAEGNAMSGKSESEYYEKLIEEDIRTLKREFAELSGLCSITELDNPIRYGALRDLGLSAAEAYLATRKTHRRSDNRAHLVTALPPMSSLPENAMTDRELEGAREIFSDISDTEIRKLYRKVTR